MKHLVCIHGIGKHKEDWTKEEGFKEQLKSLWDRYDILNEFTTFDDAVKVHSIWYDGEIIKLLENWAKQYQELLDSSLGRELLESIKADFDEISESVNSSELFTHLADLVLFYSNASAQVRIVGSVVEQILELMKQYPNDEFVLLGHSMGCAVLDRAVRQLYSDRSVENFGKFQSIIQVANTSFMLSGDRNRFYQSIVKPSRRLGVGACFSYLNINHLYDPVGQFMPFDPDDNWIDATGREKTISGKAFETLNAAQRCIEREDRFINITPNQIASKDIHTLKHYFGDPLVHIPVLSKLSGQELEIQPSDYEKYVKSIHIESNIKSTLETFEELQIGAESDAQRFWKYFEIVTKFLSTVEHLG